MDTIWANETRWILLRDEECSAITEPPRSPNARDYGNEKEVIKDYEKVGHEWGEQDAQKPSEISEETGPIEWAYSTEC